MTPADVIAVLARQPATAGLILDFDGTLAAIVDDPATAVVGEGLEPVLEALTRRLALVAVLSGRPAAFLKARIPVEGVVLMGQYGLEEWVGDRAQAAADVEAWRPAVAAAERQLEALMAGQEGVLIENKGLAVAVHWRMSPDHAAAEARAAAAVARVARATGLARVAGKLVEELRPPVGRDKGDAVRALAGRARLRTLVVIGDDEGDVPAFAAARELGGVAVGVDAGAATPAAVPAAADVMLDGSLGVSRWLEQLRCSLG